LAAQDIACPDAAQFLLSEPWTVHLPRDVGDTAWGRVRASLLEWRAANFPGDTSSLGVLVVNRAAAAQQVAAQPRAENAQTCFFVKRVSRRIEYRIAFLFTLRPAPAAGSGPLLEVRWLSGMKGAGEETWQRDVARAAPLVEQLVQYLQAVRK
jgi:hypothetical protein